MERLQKIGNEINRELMDKQRYDTKGRFEWSDPETSEIIGRHIMANYELLLETREILKRSQFQYPAPAMIQSLLDDDYFHLVQLTMNGVRDMGMALQYFAHTGRYDEAVLIAEDMLRMTESLDIIMPNVRAVIFQWFSAIARDSLLTWEGVPSEELKRAHDVLLRAEEFLMADKHFSYHLLTVMEKMYQPEFRGWHRVCSGIWHKEMFYWLDYCEMVGEVEDAPIHYRRNLIEDIQRYIGRHPLLRSSIHEHLFSPPEVVIVISTLVMSDEITTCAQIRNARTAIATELFRRERGRWPESLQELVPLYLDEIPTDPFDGKPLIYRRMREGEEFRDERYGIVVRNGVIIYSVGPDGSDDGGTMGPSVNDFYDIFLIGGNDIVFPLGDIERIEKP